MDKFYSMRSNMKSMGKKMQAAANKYIPKEIIKHMPEGLKKRTLGETPEEEKVE